MRRLLAEALGTFVLVALICGTALISHDAAVTTDSILAVSFAAGIALIAMGYALGPVSGGHFNPAITCGLAVSGRFPPKSVFPYALAHVAGGLLAALAIFFVLTYKIGWSPQGFASNGFDQHSPGGYSRTAVFVTEFIFPSIFVFAFCRVTRGKSAMLVMEPLVIGMTFTGLHLASIPVSHTSLNPARSLATAMFAETWALHQLWLFWVAPLAGGILGGIADRYVGDVS
jgi:aquaporin Z